MKLLVKMGILGLASAAAVAAVAVAQPAPPTPEQQAATAVGTRQAVFKLLGWNMDPLAGMLRGNRPFDAAVIAENAQNIANLAEMIPDAFAMDTSGFDVETAAMDNIWTGKDGFDMKAGELATAATAVIEAAGAGNDGATRAAIGRMGQVCGSCHDDHRID